jgi:hypothetical protein
MSGNLGYQTNPEAGQGNKAAQWTIRGGFRGGSFRIQPGQGELGPKSHFLPLFTTFFQDGLDAWKPWVHGGVNRGIREFSVYPPWVVAQPWRGACKRAFFTRITRTYPTYYLSIILCLGAMLRVLVSSLSSPCLLGVVWPLMNPLAGYVIWV